MINYLVPVKALLVVSACMLLAVGCRSGGNLDRIAAKTEEFTVDTSAGTVCLLEYTGGYWAWAIKLYDGPCKPQHKEVTTYE